MVRDLSGGSGCDQTIPITVLFNDGVAEIAGEFGWSERRCLKLQAASFFYYAMKARQCRWSRIDDQLRAANAPHLNEGARRRFAAELAKKLSGPGILIRWRETMSDKAKAAAAEADRELDEVIKSFKASGLLGG